MDLAMRFQAACVDVVMSVGKLLMLLYYGFQAAFGVCGNGLVRLNSFSGCL